MAAPDDQARKRQTRSANLLEPRREISELLDTVRQMNAMLDNPAARQALNAQEAFAQGPVARAITEQAGLIQSLIRDQQWIAGQVAAADEIRRLAGQAAKALEAARLVQLEPDLAKQLAAIESMLRDETGTLQRAVAAAGSLRIEAAPVDADACASVALQAFQSQAGVAEAMRWADAAHAELRSHAAALDRLGSQAQAVGEAVELSDAAQEALDALRASTRLRANKALAALDAATRQAVRQLGSIPRSAQRQQLEEAIARSLAAIREEIERLPEAQGRSASRSLQILENVLVDPVLIEAWLTSPHADLGERAPLQVFREGRADAVEGMLENALEGIPS